MEETAMMLGLEWFEREGREWLERERTEMERLL
jgi:hypothetical protein